VSQLAQPRRIAAAALALSLALTAAPASTAWAEGTLAFATAPTLPTLTSVTITAKSQTVYTVMTNFAVADTRGTKLGWNLTAQGQSASGKSAVMAQYCPEVKCGSDAEGYVAGGRKLGANSLKLSSSGASFSGGTGSAPTFQCAGSCNLDSVAAVKIVSAATGGAGEGTWTTSGFSVKSIALAVPTTLHVLPAAELYRVNILWTLATGP
jgi:hypothetical protein